MVAAATALGAAVAPLVSGAPPSLLNRRLGPNRCVEVVGTALSDYKLVKNASAPR